MTTKIIKVSSTNQTIQKIKNFPDPNRLWGSLWYEGEACCLFADTNVGKSIYAVQIAESIARTGKKVLYFDFELSDKQFQLRYTDENGNTYEFSELLFRATINPEAIIEGSFEKAINQAIEELVAEIDAKVLIIDNLSYLCVNSEKGDSASEFMINLINLKRKYDLSILVLAHTPKRQMYNPLTQNDLAGSKKQMNFFDSAFAIGKSVQDEGLRYVKQIKTRNGEIVYGTNNVIVYQIEKIDAFLQFAKVEESTEKKHLIEKTDEDVKKLENEIRSLYQQGYSCRVIEKKLGVSKSKVNRIIQK